MGDLWPGLLLLLLQTAGGAQSEGPRKEGGAQRGFLGALSVED